MKLMKTMEGKIIIAMLIMLGAYACVVPIMEFLAFLTGLTIAGVLVYSFEMIRIHLWYKRQLRVLKTRTLKELEEL